MVSDDLRSPTGSSFWRTLNRGLGLQDELKGDFHVQKRQAEVPFFAKDSDAQQVLSHLGREAQKKAQPVKES